MSIEVPCPDCSRLLRVDEIHAGKQAKCPVCETVFMIPQQGAGEGMTPESSDPSPNPFARSASMKCTQASRPNARYVKRSL